MRSAKDERNYWWAIKSAGAEVGIMRTITDGKVGKPGSAYSVSLIKIASILKGAGKELDRAQTFNVIREATAHLHVSEKEAMRMWARALRQATPRYPSDRDADPVPPTHRGVGLASSSPQPGVGTKGGA